MFCKFKSVANLLNVCTFKLLHRNVCITVDSLSQSSSQFIPQVNKDVRESGTSARGRSVSA